MRKRLMYALIDTASREQSLEVRSASGQGEVTFKGACAGLSPVSLVAEGGVAISGEGSFDAPCTPIFVGEEGVFRSNTGFQSYMGGMIHEYYFNATNLGSSGMLFLRFTLGAPCEGMISVVYGNASGNVTFSSGSRAGDTKTLLLPLGMGGVSGNVVSLECSETMNFRLTVCRLGETMGKRLMMLALDGGGAVYAAFENDVVDPLRAIPNGAADLLDFCAGEIVRRIGEISLNANMLSETVVSSIGGEAPSFLLLPILGRDTAEACLFSHGKYIRDSADYASGKAPGLYAKGDALYLAIPYSILGANVERNASALLAAAKGWIQGSGAKLWYTLDTEHETREAFEIAQRLRMPSDELTVRLCGEVDSRLVTLRAYCRKET